MTTLSRSVPTLKANILRYGFEQRCPQIFASDVLDLDLHLHRLESGARDKIAALIARAVGTEPGLRRDGKLRW